MAIVESIQNNLDAETYTTGVFIDLKNAFVIVDHNTLLEKPDYYEGLPKTVFRIKWVWLITQTSLNWCTSVWQFTKKCRISILRIYLNSWKLTSCSLTFPRQC